MRLRYIFGLPVLTAAGFALFFAYQQVPKDKDGRPDFKKWAEQAADDSADFTIAFGRRWTAKLKGALAEELGVKPEEVDLDCYIPADAALPGNFYSLSEQQRTEAMLEAILCEDVHEDYDPNHSEPSVK